MEREVRTDSPWRELIAVALVVQLFVLGNTFMSGLIWTGWDFNVALGQAVAGLVIIVWVGRRHPALALLVPLVSGVIAYGLNARFMGDMSEGHDHTPLPCTAETDWAIRELVPPDGLITVLEGDGYGCFATVTTDVASSDWRAHYEREFTDHGWETTSAPGSAAATAVRDQYRVSVQHADDRTLWIDVDPR